MVGMLERELAIYKRLLHRGFEVTFVTYGGEEDLAYSDQMDGIHILCNKTGLPPAVYENSLCSLHRDSLESCNIMKTNQLNGAELALSASRVFGKPLVARCGYIWSRHVALEDGFDSEAAVHAREVEEKVFRGATRVVVTTPAMRSDVLQRVPEAAAKITVIPNYVDTEVFRPSSVVRDERALTFVGRIAPEKNVAALLEAIQPLEVKLTIIGEGRLRPELQERFGTLDGRVNWEGNVPNTKLPAYLNRAGSFVLPSLHEGHPKALIEAMACGLPVIGGDSPGIRELICHKETGYLCGCDAPSIREAIQEVLADPKLRTDMGRNAREYVVTNYSLDKIVESECALLKETARL
jgi:glycosyltransferase involved in cell wall biosynthesis